MSGGAAERQGRNALRVPQRGAIADNSKPVADIEQGHISTASCIMANLSMKTGRPLVYDPQQRVIVGDAEATALLKRSYRQPWEHPDPEKV